MKLVRLAILSISLFAAGCIGNDFVMDTIDPVLRITSSVDTIAVNTGFQFEAMYLNNVGLEENVSLLWSSSQPEVISINDSGLAQALQIGSAFISVQYDNGTKLLEDSLQVQVGEMTTTQPTERTGTIRSTSSYTLTGDFTLAADGADLLLSIADNYQASTSLPGLYLYLTNNNTTTANALEIGPVETFSGAHTYLISNTGINEYQYLLYFCKPFNVKVGDGEIQ